MSTYIQGSLIICNSFSQPSHTCECLPAVAMHSGHFMSTPQPLLGEQLWLGQAMTGLAFWILMGEKS